MQAQFEAMMAELVAAGEAPTQEEAIGHVKSASESMPLMPEDLKSGAAGDKKEGGKKEKEESFQDTIKKTMERMQASDTTAKTATTGSGSAEAGGTSEEQMLAELMKSLGGAGGSADGSGEEGGEEDFNTMLMSMMAQLTNKEILYEPMKELHEKFPAWMQAHEGTETEAEMGRYREQQRLVGEIVGRFERKGYSDGDEGDRAFIVERMQKVSRLRKFLVDGSEGGVLMGGSDASARFAAAGSGGRYGGGAGCVGGDGCWVSDAMIRNFRPMATSSHIVGDTPTNDFERCRPLCCIRPA